MFSLCFHSVTPSILDYLMLSHSSWMLCYDLFSYSFFSLSLCSSLDNFCWSPVFEFTDPFFCRVQYDIKCFQRILHFRFCIFQFRNFHLKMFHFYAKFPIGTNVLFTFSIESFNTFIYFSLCLPFPTHGLHWSYCYWPFSLNYVSHLLPLYMSNKLFIIC